MSTPSKRGPKKWPKWKAYLIYTSDEFGTNSRGGWRIYSSQLDAMAERMARAMSKSHYGESGYMHEAMCENARAAMRAIGLVAKKGKL